MSTAASSSKKNDDSKKTAEDKFTLYWDTLQKRVEEDMKRQRTDAIEECVENARKIRKLETSAGLGEDVKREIEKFLDEKPKFIPRHILDMQVLLGIVLFNTKIIYSMFALYYYNINRLL